VFLICPRIIETSKKRCLKKQRSHLLSEYQTLKSLTKYEISGKDLMFLTMLSFINCCIVCLYHVAVQVSSSEHTYSNCSVCYSTIRCVHSGEWRLDLALCTFFLNSCTELRVQSFPEYQSKELFTINSEKASSLKQWQWNLFSIFVACDIGLDISKMIYSLFSESSGQKNQHFN
jgi:hypothetical protein